LGLDQRLFCINNETGAPMDSGDFEMRRLQLALTKISAHLDAIESRPHVMLRRAADALATSLVPEIRSEDAFIGQFAVALEKNRVPDR
jgi:hypothetical protein